MRYDGQYYVYIHFVDTCRLSVKRLNTLLIFVFVHFSRRIPCRVLRRLICSYSINTVMAWGHFGNLRRCPEMTSTLMPVCCWREKPSSAFSRDVFCVVTTFVSLVDHYRLIWYLSCDGLSLTYIISPLRGVCCAESNRQLVLQRNRSYLSREIISKLNGKYNQRPSEIIAPLGCLIFVIRCHDGGTVSAAKFCITM
jgi:hypothetical protein